MRAVVFQGAGLPMAIESLPDPEPGAGEVVIKVRRCGICASDIHMTSGHVMDFPVGTVLGHEFAGEVVAVGPSVERLNVGDRISAMPIAGCGKCMSCLSGYPLGCGQMQGYIGGFGEHMRVRESSAIRLPDSLSMADGALVEPLAVGLRGATLAKIAPGDRVLILGAGAVGLAVLFWVRQSGASRIVMSSPSRRRADMALAMGADSFETLGENESERINAALGGPPDAVIECAGAVGVLQKCVDLVKPGGIIVSLGFCMVPDPVVPALATWKQVTISFSFAYNLREFEHCADVMDRGLLQPRMMITETIPLDTLPDRFESIRNGSSQTKVHVDPWGVA